MLWFSNAKSHANNDNEGFQIFFDGSEQSSFDPCIAISLKVRQNCQHSLRNRFALGSCLMINNHQSILHLYTIF